RVANGLGTMLPMRPATPDEAALHERARDAARSAHAPYSGLAVGAALRVSGVAEPVLGVSVENASFGLTSCAERNAVFAAVTMGHRDFEAIAVHADADSVAPCGACRQVLAEFSPELTVVYSRRGSLIAASLEELLPERFVL